MGVVLPNSKAPPPPKQGKGSMLNCGIKGLGKEATLRKIHHGERTISIMDRKGEEKYLPDFYIRFFDDKGRAPECFERLKIRFMIETDVDNDVYWLTSEIISDPHGASDARYRIESFALEDEKGRWLIPEGWILSEALMLDVGDPIHFEKEPIVIRIGRSEVDDYIEAMDKGWVWPDGICELN